MKVHTKDILYFLDNNKISYKISGKLNNTYHLASIYNPIENGFYFLINDSIPNNISNSLFLVNQSIINQNKQHLITINKDPQRTYYKLLNYFSEEKSNNKIKKSSVIHPDAQIGKNVQIDDFCVIGKCKIEDNVIIKNHIVIENNTIIGNNTLIESNSVIGARGIAWIWDEKQEHRIIPPQLGGVQIGNNCIIGSNSIIVRGSINENTIIGNNVLMAPGCKIGHGTIIGDFVHFANNIATGGNTHIGAFSFIGSSVTFRPKTNIHENTIVGAGSVVIKNTTKSHLTLIGVPAKEKISKANPKGMPKPKNK